MIWFCSQCFFENIIYAHIKVGFVVAQKLSEWDANLGQIVHTQVQWFIFPDAKAKVNKVDD